MSEELKSCPFCDCTSELFENEDGAYCVECQSCFARGAPFPKHKPELAIKYWNARVSALLNKGNTDEVAL